MEHGLSKTRLYSIYSGMKRTSNQKVVTAAIQNRPSKVLSAPYRACTALPDRNTVYAVIIQNRGLWRVAIGFTDFKSRNYRSAQFCAYLIQSVLRFQIGILPPGAIQ